MATRSPDPTVPLGTRVYPLDWSGVRLTREPLAVVRRWSDMYGNQWAGLGDGRNFLVGLLEVVEKGSERG